MTNRQCYLIAFGCFDFGLLLGLLDFTMVYSVKNKREITCDVVQCSI
jgi:hypothetical protein